MIYICTCIRRNNFYWTITNVFVLHLPLQIYCLQKRECVKLEITCSPPEVLKCGPGEVCQLCRAKANSLTVIVIEESTMSTSFDLVHFQKECLDIDGLYCSNSSTCDDNDAGQHCPVMLERYMYIYVELNCFPLNFKWQYQSCAG